MKCGIDEVLKLVQDSLEENISQENFDKSLQFLIVNNFAKPNSVLNKVCLFIPKNDTCRDNFQYKRRTSILNPLAPGVH